MTAYVALLRGINVGGRNPVAMADLRAVLTEAGVDRVETYIQSGNVLFDADPPRSARNSAASRASIESRLEEALATGLGTPVAVVVRSHEELYAVVHGAPNGFGTEPDRFHSDVVFLKAPLDAAAAMSVVETREGVDRAWPGTGVVYFERLSAQRTRSRMSRIVATPEYRLMTIRNWATTTKLLGLLDRRAG